MTTFEETKRLLEHSAFFYIISTNMEGKYTYANAHYESVFGKIHGRVVGQPFEITMHPDDVKVCEEVAGQCFAHPEGVFPATIRKHDGMGGYIYTQWEYKAILTDKSEPAGIFCLGYNITEYITQQEELKLAHNTLEQKNTILREIAWNQSHVVRRPLSNIMGLTMVLENMELDQNLRNICQMLIESSKQLDEVIRTIISKTE